MSKLEPGLVLEIKLAVDAPVLKNNEPVGTVNVMLISWSGAKPDSVEVLRLPPVRLMLNAGASTAWAGTAAEPKMSANVAAAATAIFLNERIE
jgi:hypothetical protein